MAEFTKSNAIAVVELGGSMQLPVRLNGSDGENRAPADKGRATSANTDHEAILAWLQKYRSQPRTFENYRKEVMRLLAWTIQTRGKAFSSLLYEDFLLYEEYLKNPPGDHISAKRYPIGDERWRPFYKQPLSVASRKQSFRVIAAMIADLVEIGYLQRNPVKPIVERMRLNEQKPFTRHLEQEMWSFVFDYIETMPRKSELDRFNYHRTRWLLKLFYSTGMRISEVAENASGQISTVQSRKFLVVTGKGGKTRMIPMTSTLLEEMKVYRKAYGLTPLPSPGETTPLVLAVRKHNGPIGRKMLHVIVKKAFKDTADWLKAKGDPVGYQLEKASAHWIRHTAATHWLEDGIPLHEVRDLLGHANIVTTNLYINGEDLKRHDSLESASRTVGARKP